MRKTFAFFALLCTTDGAFAQAQQQPWVAQISAEDCAKISREPNGNLKITGVATVDGSEMRDINIARSGIVTAKGSLYDAVERACFGSRPR